MKKTQLLLIAAILLPVFFSCEKEPELNVDSNVLELRASLENGRCWNEGDFVLVNGTRYNISEKTGTPNTTVPDVAKASEYFGAYDFGEGSVSDNILSFELPKVIVPGAEQVVPMLAYSGSDNLMFKNILGFLKLQLTGTATVTEINLTSNNPDQKLSGAAEADLFFAGAPEIRMTSAANPNVSVKFGDQGLKLSADAQDIIIPLPPAKYEEGFRLIIYDAEGKAMEELIDYNVEVKRGEEKTLPPFEYLPGSDAPFEMKITAENDLSGTASWSVDDDVCINGAAYHVTVGEGSATVSADKVIRAESYVVVAPAKAYRGHAANMAKVVVPEIQYAGTPVRLVNPQVGVTAGEAAELKYMAGAITVKISGSNIINELQLISKDASKGISGKMDVVFSGEDFTARMNNDSKKSVTLKCPGGISVEGGKTFTFIVPAGEYPQGFRLVLSNNRQQMHVVESGAVTVTRNTSTALENINWTPSADDSGNLSSYGWANCYIVSGEGNYSFDTKKIDGSAVKDITKVDWLWANSVKGDARTLISDITYKNGQVSFKASAQEGNVLLAAFNSANEIVWSWHIWLTDEPKTINMENMLPTDLSRGYFMMDRNLGATSPEQGDGEETFGFFYQYGRKDPFYGGTKMEFSKDANGNITQKEPFKNAATGTVCNEAYPQAKWQAAEGNAENGNMDFATKNPMYFLSGNSTAGDNNWLAKGNEFRAWSAEDCKLWHPFYKTNYDPCPVGYKVPRQGTFNEFNSNQGKWDVDFSGFVFTSTSGESTWFPAQGIRMAHPEEGAALSRVDSGIQNWICIWTSDLFSGGYSCQSNSLNISSSSINTQASYDAWGNGLNVRCVKIYEFSE